MDVREKLSKSEFTMLRSLGKQGGYMRYDAPLWRVGRRWDTDHNFELEARDACESLLKKGLVIGQRLHCCSYHTSMGEEAFYVLSARGIAFLERANLPRTISVIEPDVSQVVPTLQIGVPAWMRSLSTWWTGLFRGSSSNQTQQTPTKG